MAKRGMPGWFVDVRFWVVIFIVGFWPAVMIAKFVGLAILLAVVIVGAMGTQRLARRA
jgi:hypothetical protein